MKASTLNSFEATPQLAVLFRNANKKVFDKEPYVTRNLYSLFQTFEEDLRDQSIPPREYAYETISLLQSWVKNMGLECVPAKTFCSEWALKKFMRIWESKTVSVAVTEDDLQAELLQSEMLVARTYINENRHNVVRIPDIVQRIRPLLSQRWLDLYENDPKGRKALIREAIEQLKIEYHVYGNLVHYNDILDAL